MERKDRALFAGGAALITGVTGAALFKDAGVGLNVFLWFLSVGLVTAFAWAKGVVRVQRPAMALLLLSLVFSFFLVWRDSTHLTIANWMVVVSIVSVAALRSKKGSIWSASVWEYTGQIVDRLGRTVAYPFLLLAEIPWQKFSEGPRAKRRAAYLRGTVLAVPPLLLFGTLFSRADSMFEKTVISAVQFDGSSLAKTITLFLLFSLVGAGLIYPYFVGEKSSGEQLEKPPKENMKIGMTEIQVVLFSLCGMFALFVVIQLKYLFGGSDQIVTATGLNYSSYARQGFFELVWVAGLMLPLLVAVQAVAKIENEKQKKTLRVLLTALVSLLFIVMASAIYRMEMYVSAYGLSELRVSTTAFMLWLALVFAWFVATLFIRKTNRFAPGALISAMFVVIALNVSNPDAMIANYNMKQLNKSAVLDTAHLARLSADAVPTIIKNWDEIHPNHQEYLAEQLQKKWGVRERDWRSTTVSREAAYRAVTKLK